MWERETRLLRAFAGDDDLAHAPVDVVESQARHFAGTQPETDKQSQDREVAAAKVLRLSQLARSSATSRALSARGRLARRQLATPGTQSAKGQRRETVQMTEAEEAPQPGDDVLCRPDAAALALVE